jgi:hypothetical protein
MSGPKTVWLVAGEDSGDQLGAKLMRALRAAAPGTVFGGVGGEAMAEEGFTSLFPLDDVAVMGYLPVLARARTLLRRIRETATVVASPMPWPSGSGRRRPASRSSITCRRASGPGGRGGLRACAASSTT